MSEPKSQWLQTRRQFVSTTAIAGIGVTAGRYVLPEPAHAEAPTSPRIPEATGERMAAAEGSFYRAYRSQPSSTAVATTWVQIDLGSSQRIESIKLYPSKTHLLAGEGFPLRFRIECSDDPSFGSPRMFADRTHSDYPDPGDRIVQFRNRNTQGRYVRLTATKLRPNKLPALFATLPRSMVEPVEKAVTAAHVLALAKIEVLAGGKDLALQRPVAVDPLLGSPADSQQLTRAVRPQGEALISDNPQNVTSPAQWRPAVYRARPPLADTTLQARVQLQDGLFLRALQANVRYLLSSYSVDDLLRQFRRRAGQTALPSSRPSGMTSAFWEDDLAGSNAGRFLMGAANTLHSIDDAELRQRMDAVVAGIAACRQANGYIMGYPEDTFFVSERGAYTRAWLTHGLIDAGIAGNAQAFELLRGYYDWYNSRAFLPEALRGCIQGGQGMVANSRLYFTPVGKPADIHTLQRYFQENYWLQDLAARRPEAVWQYPYDRPHVYLLTNLEAYLDLYRATGEQRYLDAVLGGWELYSRHWQTVGGSFSIIELQENKPDSHPLYERLGENCGNAFWTLLNHRLHLLRPEEERYVAEIERSIYNVLLANQNGDRGIRYHTMLVGQKEKATCDNTCCEGQGTRLIASLPQFVYSLADDGVYVNLFAPSTLRWQQAGTPMRIEMLTSFPEAPAVRLKVHVAAPTRAALHIRIPSWATATMPIVLNGERVAAGSPGSYVTLDRAWNANDEISFELPIGFTLTKYTGADQIAGRERYFLTYGPLLMAAIGAAETELSMRLADSPKALIAQLQPVEGRPLHFAWSSFTDSTTFVPYFAIEDETFSCAPIIEAKPTLL